MEIGGLKKVEYSGYYYTVVVEGRTYKVEALIEILEEVQNGPIKLMDKAESDHLN